MLNFFRVASFFMLSLMALSSSGFAFAKIFRTWLLCLFNWFSKLPRARTEIKTINVNSQKTSITVPSRYRTLEGWINDCSLNKRVAQRESKYRTLVKLAFATPFVTIMKFVSDHLIVTLRHPLTKPHSAQWCKDFLKGTLPEDTNWVSKNC
jgi:hypothetical protein